MNHLEFKRFLSLHGLTQARTAELCHVCPRTVAYWLSGGRTISPRIPELIALKLARQRERFE